MKYVIHSKSERGFWNNDVGWVYAIHFATQFSKEEKLKVAQFPLTEGYDAEWLVYTYEDKIV